ncbi:MAG: hypothetical protein ACK48U_15490 [Planctomyces sp.]|jgi:hypothetical protein
MLKIPLVNTRNALWKSPGVPAWASHDPQKRAVSLSTLKTITAFVGVVYSELRPGKLKV